MSKEPFHLSNQQIKYLRLLSESYPTIQEVCTEIINLQAILNLPKGTEHFMSDLHGEYEAFYHILNNCSGVIREKMNQVLGERLSPEECSELCTLIYYPEEKLEYLKQEAKTNYKWYEETLYLLIELAKHLSSKYTRSKVRKALPKEYGYIIDELLHAQPDEDNNQFIYHKKIIETIITIENGDEFIIALVSLIKRLAVDYLHIVGDIFDRGSRADSIMDLLIQYHSVDFQWGNHDILWMGATAGSCACIARVVRNCLSYGNMEILENGYGISLRSLALFSERVYHDCPDSTSACLKAISIIMFKLEGQIIKRHSEYEMDSHLLLDKIDYDNRSILIDGNYYKLNDIFFPTIDPKAPYELTRAEQLVMDELRQAFYESERLHRHIEFLYSKGSMYRCFNGNLLFHGCIPMNLDGSFQKITLNGHVYSGRAYMEYADKLARRAYFEKENEEYLDFMWYLWCGEKSPVSGRNVRTFERMFIDDTSVWEEEKNAYYSLYQEESICIQILKEFGLEDEFSHIINGHTPVRVGKGESPVKANGKLIVIDGGFCKAYQKTTGIAGYTLIYNSHGMRIKSHQPFESIEQVLNKNKDIESSSDIFETENHRVMVKDTDNGKVIFEKIEDLKLLLTAYRQGILTPSIT